MKDQLVNELIKYFLDESDRPNVDIPKIYANKRALLRGLINMREPKKIDEKILEKEDKLLNEELKEKNITDVSSLDGKIILLNKDITEIKCDAIVNNSDETMLGCFIPNHACINNQIHTYAGIRLRLKCFEITKGKKLSTSKVVLTDSYNLPCKYIIHTIGPVIENDITKDDIENLKSCYINSLELAKKNNIKTITFPCISTGNRHFPKDLAAKTVIQTVKEYLKEDNYFEKVIFSVYTLEDNNLYEKYINEIK